MASLIAVVRGSQQRHSGGAGATSHFRFTLVMLQVKTHPFLGQCQWCHEHEHHGLPKGDVGHLCSAVGDVQFQQERLLRQWPLPKGCFSFLISFFSFSLKSKTNIQKIKKKTVCVVGCVVARIDISIPSGRLVEPRVDIPI